MRICNSLLISAALLAGCTKDTPPEQNLIDPAGKNALASNAQGTNGSAWDMQSSGEGTALALGLAGQPATIRIFCPAGARQLIVNVPAFQPIGSEERLSFGSSGQAHALVADPRGDAQRGGVSGTGPVPGNLVALLSGPVAASYGAQSSGPHPAPPRNLVAEFAPACMGQAGEPLPAAPATANQPVPAGACLTQDGKPVPADRLRALGTEPFWGARIDGRCVTYSHPDDQQGTRVWTKFSGTAANGSWTGNLNGRPFVLRTRAEVGCSDGMSDNLYPIAVTLTVGGEQRTGCAGPL